MRRYQPKFEQIIYNGSSFTKSIITQEDLLQIDQTIVDHYLAVDLGVLAFRNHRGEWIEYSLAKRSIGSVCLKLLELVQCEPGTFFSPQEIAELTTLNSLGDNNNLSARWRALRLSHDETFKQPNFFLSKRTGGIGVAWNPEKTFMQILRIKTERDTNSDELKK